MIHVMLNAPAKIISKGKMAPRDTARASRAQPSVLIRTWRDNQLDVTMSPIRNIENTTNNTTSLTGIIFVRVYIIQ